MIPLKQNEPNHLCSMCAKMAHIINKSWDNLSHMVCIVGISTLIYSSLCLDRIGIEVASKQIIWQKF